MTLINPLAAANTLPPAAATVNLRENRDQNLRNDQVVRATVAEGGLERILLQMGTKKFWVNTETPLTTGQKLSLQVFENNGEIELRMVQANLSDHLRQVLHLAGRSFDLLPLLEALANPNHPVFKYLSPTGQNALQGALLFFSGQTEGSDGRFLKSMVRVLGLDLEQRLANDKEGEILASLKGALLEIVDRSKGREGPLYDRVRRLHHLLEATQIFRARLAEEGTVLLPLPLPFIEYGYLVADRHPSGGQDEEHYEGLLGMFLQLSSLGAINIHMLFDQRGLTLRIRTESDHVTAFIKSCVDELTTLLDSFHLVGLTVSSDAVPPQKNLIGLLNRKQTTVFDTRV